MPEQHRFFEFYDAETLMKPLVFLKKFIVSFPLPKMANSNFQFFSFWKLILFVMTLRGYLVDWLFEVEGTSSL